MRGVSGVYLIENVVSGKVYVGSAIDIGRRLYQHNYYLQQGSHHNRHLQASFKKHGPKAFRFRPLLVCSKTDLLFYEQKCLDRFHKLYNILPRAGSQLGNSLSLTTKGRISDSLKIYYMENPEVRAAHAQRIKRKYAEDPGYTERNRQGQKVRFSDPDQRHKASLAAKRRFENPEERKRVGDAHRGKKLSQKARERMSAAQQLICQSEQGLEQRRRACAKAHASPEARLKMAEAVKRRWAQPGARERQSAAIKKTLAKPEVKEKMMAARARRKKDDAGGD